MHTPTCHLDKAICPEVQHSPTSHHLHLHSFRRGWRCACDSVRHCGIDWFVSVFCLVSIFSILKFLPKLKRVQSESTNCSIVFTCHFHTKLPCTSIPLLVLVPNQIVQLLTYQCVLRVRMRVPCVCSRNICYHFCLLSLLPMCYLTMQNELYYCNAAIATTGCFTMGWSVSFQRECLQSNTVV